MRRSLLVTLEYPPQVGGVANYYYNLVNQLPAEKISVLTNADHRLLSRWPLWPKWLPALWTIWKKISQDKIELLLVGQVLPLGTVAWLLKLVRHTPYIIMTHAMDITYPQKYPRKKWLLKKILNSAEQITTVSNYTRQEIKKLLSGRQQHKVTIIPPGPNITPAKYPYPPAVFSQEEIKNKKIILSVGRLVARKGHDRVIQVLPEILRHYPQTKYIIAGHGENKSDLQQLAKNLQVDKNIVFLHNLNNQQIAWLYQNCDLFIMPSRQLANNDVEGFGLVYLEANSFGKPVIAGQSGGVSDAVIDGQTGYLVDPEDKEMIAKAILRVLDNQPLAQKMGQQGAQRVKEKFSWPLQAQRLMHLLKQG